jgi:hypothetical protein
MSAAVGGSLIEQIFSESIVGVFFVRAIIVRYYLIEADVAMR